MSRILKLACLATAGIVLVGCGTKLENALRNPKVDEVTWKAEQEYFVQRLEEFCFDRRWDEAPLEMMEMRGEDYGYRYRLWGEITDDYALPDVSEKRYRLICRVVATLPFLQVTLHDRDPVRSSPWWNGHRRAVFKDRLTDRFGVLYSATKPRVDRFDGEILLLRDGETVLEISHFKKNSGTSVQVYRRRAEPVEAVTDPDDLPFGAERTRFFLRDGERTRQVEVYHYEGVEDELPLNQVLDLDQLPPEAVVALDEERKAMTEAEKRQLRDQVAYNFNRLEREVSTADFRHDSEMEYRREMAEYRRKREAERKAANHALLQEVVKGLYSASTQTQGSGSSGSTGGSASMSSASGSSGVDLYSPLVPWASIHEEAARARQQIQANHDAEQARQRAAASAGAGTPAPSRAAGSTSPRTGTADRSGSRTSSGSSGSPDEPVASRTPSKPDSADRDQTESNSKREPRRIYEPAPEVVVGTTDTYFGDRDLAIFQARLGAALDIDDICWDKGARSDRPTSADIRAGNVPPRWSMANPDCKQNSNGKWKCRTRVSGTCYRMR